MSVQTVTGDVSRETLARLETYLDLLRKWSPKINLVAPATLDSAWDRHIRDSAQLFPLIDESTTHLADLGSGAGFPGLVLAVLACEHRPDLRVTLIESDLRKATFLRTAARALEVDTTVIADRIEHVPPLAAQTVTARALAPFLRLLPLAARHLAPGGQALFPKGKNWQSDVAEARVEWTFTASPHRSETHPAAVLLEIRDLTHV